MRSFLEHVYIHIFTCISLILSSKKYIPYDIYLLTAVGLTPSSSGRVHIYAQAIHRTTQTEYPEQKIRTIRIHKHNNKNT